MSLKQFKLLIFLAIIPLDLYGNCSKGDLNAAIYSAQTLKPETAELINSLSECKSIAIKQQAIFWGAFYFAQIKDEEQTVALIDKTFTAPKSKKPQDQIYFEARRGQWKRLKKKIDSGDPAYLANLNARIVLAHSLLISGRFNDALDTYREYLKIKTDDDLVDAEYLFALIWAQKSELAYARITHLKTFPLGTYLRKSAEHAELIVREGMFQTNETETRSFLTGSIGTGIGITNAHLGSKQTIYAEYSDDISARFSNHNLKSDLDQKNQSVSEISLSYEKQFESFFISSRLGYFSGEEGTPLGKLELGLQLSDYVIRAGVAREALTLEHIQAEFHQGIATDSAYLGISIGHWAEYTGTIAREDELAPYEMHDFNLKLPIFYTANRRGLFLVAPISLRSHPKPSPFYESRPRTLTVQGGLRFDYALSMKADIQAQAVVGSRYRNSVEKQGSYETTVEFNGDLRVVSVLSEKLKGIISLAVDSSSKEEFANDSHMETHFEAAISFTP